MTYPKLARLLALAVLALGLTDCDRVQALFKPKPSPYAFDIRVEMSPRAEASLKRNPVDLAVYASYYGDAAPAYRAEADNLNRIYLGEERWDFPATARRMHLHGQPIDTSKLPHTRDGQPQVFVSVGPEGGDPDDMLACRNFIGPIRLAQQTVPVLRCEFDTEHYWEESDSESSAG